MTRSATTLFVIFALLTITIVPPALSQPPEKTPDLQSVSQQKKPDMKRVFEAETERFNADSAKFDPVKADREAARQQTQKKWSTTKKTLVIAAIAVAVAAVVFLLVKYGKNCLRYEDDCDPILDEFCQCEEYERRNP